ncbi:MAG TPA: hypothetical protein ENJ53_03485 [Phaeodactylibacter sp.]|nr:hypothetical protein [Phaeodactylibacter sp.]
MKGTSTQIKLLSTLMLLLFLSINVWSQTQSPLDIALRYLEQNKTQSNLTDADIADMVITDNYFSKNSGATMIYFLQRHQGIKVYDAMYNAVVKDGEVIHSGSRLISDLAAKINTSQPSLTPQAAIEAALSHLEIGAGALVLKERKKPE